MTSWIRLAGDSKKRSQSTGFGVEVKCYCAVRRTNDTDMARILIIDDSAFQRRIVRGMLTPEGHEVVEATDGAEGVALAKEGFDLVLVDLIMPEMDGFAVLEVLHRELPGLPTASLTADIQEATKRQCLALGARAFLNKPPQRSTLLSLVQELSGR